MEVEAETRGGKTVISYIKVLQIVSTTRYRSIPVGCSCKTLNHVYGSEVLSVQITTQSGPCIEDAINFCAKCQNHNESREQLQHRREKASIRGWQCGTEHCANDRIEYP